MTQEGSAPFYKSAFLPRARMRSKGLCDYPARACAERGYVISRGVCPVVVSINLHFFWNQSFLSQNTHTHRLLIEFNGLWYSLAARQVFVAIANPDSLSFG